jgi:hypothetical protein
VGLHVLDAVTRPQFRNQLFLVARGQQRRQQDDVGNARRERRYRGVSRVDDEDLRLNVRGDDAAKQ